MTEAAGEMIVYRTDDGRTEIQLRAVDGTVWLTQAEIAALFDTQVPNINKHISAVLSDGEQGEATISAQEIVRQEGSRQVKRTVQVYNLDMILSVGYRVRSVRAVRFRQWATTVLREYLVKGFALNDERLRQPGGHDYFDELLARIRDIRASEKRFYQKVRDLFAQTSVDYDGTSELARTFFATIQNKLVYAVTGRTAAELIVLRADPHAPNMGLTSWAGSTVRKTDVTVSKNYLTAGEIDELNRLTTMFLDFAEDRTRRRQQIRMAEWIVQTDRFLDFNERQVLSHAGRVSQNDMQKIAHERFDDFDDQRRAREREEADREAAEELAALEAEARRLSIDGERDDQE
ncbi:virulence RhuM family protein [Plantactinospora sp. WMMB334]|uniref:virulence RhuM family protein n=1 Tax=Plantactinospora sp. WMMB334 TaxID=3404119 RepID=UPI003B949651